MKLEITYSNELLTKQFGNWLINKINDLFIQRINKSKLIPWDIYLNQEPSYKSIYLKKISTFDILMIGIRNLVCDDIPGKLIIKIDPNQYVPGLDRIRINSICKLITYGNTSIKGYPIILDILNEIADNIDNYIEQYMEGV